MKKNPKETYRNAATALTLIPHDQISDQPSSQPPKPTSSEQQSKSSPKPSTKTEKTKST